MRTIVIIDSQGPAGISNEYRRLLPLCEIEGFEPAVAAGQPCHPHGQMCGWCAGVIQRQPARLVFLRIFGEGARALSGGTDWALDELVRLDLPAGTVINRSWGMAAPGQEAIIGRVVYGAWVDRYVRLLRDRGWVDFGAAGNSDANDRGDDISFPQAMMPEYCNIIGAHDRAGMPCRFSSDGHGLQCMFWADRILLPEAGGWSVASGTSFAAPKAAGVCALRGLSNEDWRGLVSASAPEGWGEDEPWHPKYGFGSREHLWQTALLAVSPALWPPAEVPASVIGAAAGPERWVDFKRAV